MGAIVTSQVHYGLSVNYWFQLVLVLGTQLTGFGLAGLCRQFLVWSSSMVWLQNLVVCSLLCTLHSEDKEEGTQSGSRPETEVGHGVGMMGRQSRRPMTRYRYFVIISLGSFLFFFLPGLFLLVVLIHES